MLAISIAAVLGAIYGIQLLTIVVLSVLDSVNGHGPTNLTESVQMLFMCGVFLLLAPVMVWLLVPFMLMELYNA